MGVGVKRVDEKKSWMKKLGGWKKNGGWDRISRAQLLLEFDKLI